MRARRLGQQDVVVVMKVNVLFVFVDGVHGAREGLLPFQVASESRRELVGGGGDTWSVCCQLGDQFIDVKEVVDSCVWSTMAHDR